MHDLITCESKVQVVVALGRHEVLFALGRQNIFELGGITRPFFFKVYSQVVSEIMKQWGIGSLMRSRIG